MSIIKSFVVGSFTIVGVSVLSAAITLLYNKHFFKFPMLEMIVKEGSDKITLKFDSDDPTKLEISLKENDTILFSEEPTSKTPNEKPGVYYDKSSGKYFAIKGSSYIVEPKFDLKVLGLTMDELEAKFYESDSSGEFDPAETIQF